MTARPADKQAEYLAYLVTALILLAVVYVRVRLLPVPLERDEGEFAYMGQLLLKGYPSFSHAYTMKLPGVSIMYAIFMLLFGQSPVGIHAGLLAVNGLSILFVYLIGARLLGRSAALYSCAGYAVTSLSMAVNGVFAHATHFVVLFGLAGFLLLLRALEQRERPLLLASGLCFGLAFTMKQHAAPFLFFALLYYGWRVRKAPAREKGGEPAGGIFLLAGMLVPYGLILGWMAGAGSLADFWFWTVQYAREYVRTQPLVHGWANLTGTFGAIAAAQLPFWLLAAAGSLLGCLRKEATVDRIFLSGLLLASCAAVSPGLIFRSHYFILLLPAVAIAAGTGLAQAGAVVSGSPRVARFLPATLLLLAALFTFHHDKDLFFRGSPEEVSRAVYGINPFPEAQRVAAYLKSNTAATERIAVLGSEPEIFFYAERLSATGHIYMYGLMEDQPYAERMQMQLVNEIETAQPPYVVLVNIYDSWAIRSSSSKPVLEWAQTYLGKHYDQAGVVQIRHPESTRYLWGDEAAGFTPGAGAYLILFKRKGRADLA